MSNSLPALGSYIEALNCRIGAYVPSLDCTGVDVLLLPCDADHNPIILTDQAYGEFGVDHGASSDTDGQANTDAMAKAGSALANAIIALSTPEQPRMFLPAKRDLVAIWASCKELFDDSFYWSSTQDGAHYAWGQNFGYGNVYYWDKGSASKAFPVRRISASSL